MDAIQRFVLIIIVIFIYSLAIGCNWSRRNRGGYFLHHQHHQPIPSVFLNIPMISKYPICMCVCMVQNIYRFLIQLFSCIFDVGDYIWIRFLFMGGISGICGHGLSMTQTNKFIFRSIFVLLQWLPECIRPCVWSGLLTLDALAFAVDYCLLLLRLFRGFFGVAAAHFLFLLLLQSYVLYGFENFCICSSLQCLNID